MKNVILLTIAWLHCLGGSAGAQQTVPDTTHAVYREVVALNRAMEQSAAGATARGASAFYADDAIIRTARRIVARGRQQIERYFDQVRNAVWKLEVIQVGGHNDAPYQVGRSVLIHGTRPDTSVVDFVVYWRRQSDGKLRIELDYYH